jgi:hypothetical protein
VKALCVWHSRIHREEFGEANGDSLIAAMHSTYAAKVALADKIRAHLSLVSRRRLDYTCGKDDLGLLSFLGVTTAGK